MKINVTQEDIDNGEPSSRKCPVAIAILSAGFDDVRVEALHLRFVLDRFQYARSTPDIVADFLEEFDSGAAVEPFSFTLEVE